MDFGRALFDGSQILPKIEFVLRPIRTLRASVGMTVRAVQGCCWKHIVQHPDTHVDSIKGTETVLVQVEELDDPLATTDEKC